MMKTIKHSIIPAITIKETHIFKVSLTEGEVIALVKAEIAKRLQCLGMPTENINQSGDLSVYAVPKREGMYARRIHSPSIEVIWSEHPTQLKGDE
jgi:hypothetical protein